MPDNDKIRYSDIIEPDDSIERLIRELSELNKSYETMVNAIRAGADRIVRSLKSASGATKEGRQSIDEAAAAASRLERAYNELMFAMSDTGKEVARLRAQTSDQNKVTVQQMRYAAQAASSYDRLKSDLKEMVSLYKSLTDAEREDSNMGRQLLNDIINLRGQIKAIDDQFKLHTQQLSEVEKAEQRLAFLQSEEGQRLIELRKQINELSRARRNQKATIDPIEQAQQKLAQAQSEENVQLKLLSTQIREANRVAQLQAQLANSTAGSYNALSAQYGLNVIRLNNMSQAMRETTAEGIALEEETRAIRARMIALQEATGNYTLSVGHYQNMWSGLGFSVAQVVRELPAAAVSLNTFFLAISNNVPMVIDEIRRLREQNVLLRAEGKPTVSVTKSIVSSLFSWNTALVALLTVFTVFGKEIITWIGNLFRARNAVISTQEALKNIGKELENTNGSYGQNVVTLKRLREEWKNLKTEAEKTQWIKDNKTEFDNLGVSVNNVTEAENIFVENTQAVLNALRLRAKAAAAQKLAEEQYEKALVARNNAETENKQYNVGTIDANGNLIINDEYRQRIEEQERLAQQASRQVQSSVTGMGVAGGLYSTAIARQKQIEGLLEESKAAEGTADAYFDLADGYREQAKALLDAAGIDANHRRTRQRGPRDLTDTINRNDITIQRKYEESVTELLQDEYAKRRKSAADEVQDENNKLREMYRKNEEYVANVDKKYKELTESQKEQIAQQQKWITETVANNLKALDLELQRIKNEQSVNSLQIARNNINTTDISSVNQAVQQREPVVTANLSITRDASQMERSLVQERELMEKNLDLEYALILDTNRKLLAAGDEQARSEEEIITELNRKKLELWTDYDKQILDTRQQDIEAQLGLVQRGSQEELDLLLQQNEIARQRALVENAAMPAAQQQSTDVINSQFNRSGNLIRGQFELEAFDQQQKLDEAVFNEVEQNERDITRFKLQQERDRWEKQIALAKARALDWSKTQIDAAEATVKGIDRQLADLDNVIKRIGKNGLGVTLLESLGLKDDQIDALQNAVNIVIENLQSILDAEVELAEQAVEAAEERVSAAQEAYDAEVEARNNGYANNVATAKKELEQEKKNQQQKQKLLEAAQRRQDALNSVLQASSLITASANLWSAFSSIPIVGPALALAAIATMWASFAAAKIKARQVTAQSEQEYGEGGIEFLEGGSHASGHDINLGIKNHKKKRMKAEGGEALAIINKKNTRKYRALLPEVIESFNKGVFEDKYMNVFTKGSEAANLIISKTNNNIDLTQIENDLRAIKKQNSIRYSVLPDGTVIVQYKNVKRIIRN